METSNYRAWKVDPSGYLASKTDIERLKHIARYAILAPSGHNSQPWALSIEGQNLIVSVNYQRALSGPGKDLGEPEISLGAFLETLDLAALGFGRRLNICITESEEFVATVSLGDESQPDPSLLAAIATRTSNRGAYDTKSIDSEVLALICNSELPGVSTAIVTKRPDIDFLCEQTAQGTKNILSRPDFKSELSEWVRNNWTKQFDGMPGFTQGMPGIPSLMGSYAIRHLDISKKQAVVDAERVRESGAIILVLQQRLSSSENLNAGRLFASICIRAAQLGFATSAVAAAAMSEETNQATVDRFDLQQAPKVCVRVGRAIGPARHSPRWPLEHLFS